jgi:hypothetical protein
MNAPNLVRTGHINDVQLVLGSQAFGRTDKFLTPTQQVCAELQGSYSYFNQCLFAGELPECMLNVEVSGQAYYGYFRPYGFADGQGKRIHQICINPKYVHSRTAKAVLSTLVHEMCHLGIFEMNPNQKVTGYHCKKWAALMEAVGLIPSNTGKPDGRQTGYQMTHYVKEGGLFERATDHLLSQGFHLTWGHGCKGANASGDPDDTQEPKQNKGKVKLACPEAHCDLRVWGKATAHVLCGEHKIKLIAEDV